MSGGFLSNSDIIAANMHFPQVKFEYNGNGRIIFVGKHYVHGAPTSHPKWMITKFTYDGVTGYNIDIEKLEGPYDDRAVLNWN